METYAHGDLVFDLTDTGPTDGPPVLLLHGWPQNRHQWDAVAPGLAAAGFRVLAPDQRGYSPGARPRGRRSYTYSELVGDTVALIDALGVESAHVVGHDWGAAVAWALASRHPGKVRTLTAVSVPHPQAFMGAMRRGQALKSWYMMAFQLPVLPELGLARGLGHGFLTRAGMTDEMVHRYVDPLGRDGMTCALNWYRALPFSMREHGFGRPATMPTTFVWSDGDAAVTRTAAEATQRYVDAPYRFAVLEGVSHWIPDEAPDACTDLILERIEG